MTKDIDLAGFNPAEPRAAGRWTTGGTQGAQAKNPNRMSPAQFAALQRQKIALTAEAKHLRALIAASKIGVHRGVAGKHVGPKGTKVSKAAKVAAAKNAVSTAKGAAGGGGKTKPKTLVQQVAALKVEVAKLKVEWAKIQRRRKK